MALTTIQKINRLGSDSDLWHDIVHGPETDSVPTDGGAVMTAAAAVRSLKVFVMRGVWATGTHYEFKDLYVDNGVVYMVLREHVATTVADDLMAGAVAVYQDGAFMQDGAGAALRTPQDKMRERLTVQDYVGGGVTAFSAAAHAAPSGNSQAGQTPAIPSADWGEVIVGPGLHNLEDLPDTAGKQINWVLAPGAVVNGMQNLYGRVSRPGAKLTASHFGITDSAVTLSVQGNGSPDAQAPISGFTDPAQLSAGNGRDTVALYAGNRLPGAVYGTAAVASFSADGAMLATPFTDTQLKQLRRGMVITTRHTPQPYSALLQEWTANSITVTPWRLVDGSPAGPAALPPGTTGLDVNTFRKVWGLNVNAFIDPISYGNAVNTVEIGIRNTKGECKARGGLIEANGHYVTNLGGTGSYYCDAGYIVNGLFVNGIQVNGAVTSAFVYDGTKNPGGDPLASLLYAKNASGTPFYQIKPDGSSEVGLRGGGGTLTVDAHTGVIDCDYDVRQSFSGGTGVAGGGTYSVYASSVQIQASTSVDIYTVLRPSTDNTIGLGQATRRWSTIYAGTSVISSSDGTLKKLRGDGSFTEDELAAWGDVRQVLFQFNDAIEEKGADKARVHSGYIAQAVQTAFAARGLDVSHYGFWCEDTLYEAVSVKRTVVRQKMETVSRDVREIEVVNGVPTLRTKTIQTEIGVTIMTAVVDAQGQPVIDEWGQVAMYPVPVMEEVDEDVEVQQAIGTRLALRYSECEVIEAAYMRARIAALEEEVAAMKRA